jgi:hypothetical protein
MKPNKLNRQVVRSAATMLILIDGNTTAQTVKAYLQERGYRAGQSEVSCWLLRIAHREGWTVNDNGTHRVYLFHTFKNTPVGTLVTGPSTDLPIGIWRNAN